MKRIIQLILLVFLHAGFESNAQNRKVTAWKQGEYHVMIAHYNNQPRWAEMSRKTLPFELPAIVRGLNRENYILQDNGHWVTESDFKDQIDVFCRYGNDDTPFRVTDGQIIDTENDMISIAFSMKNGFKNIRLVSLKDSKAASQSYIPNTKILTHFPRNQSKTALTADIPETPILFHKVELAMCENTFSIHLPGGERLFQLIINRTLPEHFYGLKDTTSTQGIFVTSNQHKSGNRIVVSQQVLDNEVVYTLENQNEFDVEVTLGFGSEYNIKYPPALGNKQFGHPESMDFGFRPTRIDKAILKGKQKVENIRVYLDACEYARSPFSLSVSSIKPVD